MIRKYKYQLVNSKGEIREEFKYSTSAIQMKFYYSRMYLEDLIIKRVAI
jgi:hypothetical protein